MMRDKSLEITTEVLQAFADAWNRHDVDALMAFMTNDCGFEALQVQTFAGRVTRAA